MVYSRIDRFIDRFDRDRNKVSIVSIDEVDTIRIETTYNKKHPSARRPLKSEVYKELCAFCKTYLGQAFNCIPHKDNEGNIYSVSFERKEGMVAVNKYTTPAIQNKLRSVLEAADDQACGLTVEVVAEGTDIRAQQKDTRSRVGL